MKKLVLLAGIMMGVISFPLLSQTTSKNKSNRDLFTPSIKSTAAAKTSAKYEAGRSVNYYWYNSNWNLNDTSLYTFNVQGLLSEKTNRNQYPSNRTKYQYDAKGRITQVLNEYYDSFNELWVGTYLNTIVFDANDNEIENSSSTYNTGTQQWELSGGTKTNIVYSSGKRFQSVTYQNWNSSSNSWQDYAREVNYQYNATGAVLQYETQHKSGSNWVNDERIKLSYSLADVLVELQVEYWDGTSYVKADKYTNIGWHEWTGDLNNSTVQSYTWQTWGSPQVNQWNISGRSNSTFDAYGGYVTLEQDFMNSNWVNSYRSSVFYDTKYNHTGNKYESWNSSLNQWTTDSESKIIYTYDGMDRILTKVTQFWDDSTESLLNSYMQVFDNYQLISGIEKNSSKQEHLSIYPNPFQFSFTLRVENQIPGEDLHFTLYDILGNTVLQTPLEGQEIQVQRGDLQNGIYFYSVTDSKAILLQGKLIAE